MRYTSSNVNFFVCVQAVQFKSSSYTSVLYILSNRQERARFNSAENIPLWNFNKKKKHLPVYPPLFTFRTYYEYCLLICHFCHLQLLCENSCFKGINKVWDQRQWCSLNVVSQDIMWYGKFRSVWPVLCICSSLKIFIPPRKLERIYSDYYLKEQQTGYCTVTTTLCQNPGVSSWRDRGTGGLFKFIGL